MHMSVSGMLLVSTLGDLRMDEPI